MSDANYEPDESQDEPNPRDLRHQLAERSREADELRAQLEATKRDAAFDKALGENADAPWTPYFKKGYEGDIDAEAIRKAAAEAGFLAQTSPPAQQPQPDDLSAHSRMAANAAGGSGATTIDWEQALAEADQIGNEAEREAAILGVVERYGGTTSRTAQ